jgi:hypothetical protein
VRAGQLITPDELMSEVDEVAGVINALDRDNFPTPGILTEAKVLAGAWNIISVHQTDTSRTRSHKPMSSINLHAVPDGNGNDWVIARATTDTILQISFFASIISVHPLFVGLRVAGRVWRGPWSNRGDGDAFPLDGSHLLKIYAPVSQGTTLIEPVYGQTTEHLSSPAAWDTTFEDRSIVVRELVR